MADVVRSHQDERTHHTLRHLPVPLAKRSTGNFREYWAALGGRAAAAGGGESPRDNEEDRGR